jgi:sulfide:quinone oxidoreductase
MFARFSGRGAWVAAISTASMTTMSLGQCEGEIKKDKNSQKILVVGGGTAGIGIAAMLCNEGMTNVTVVEPKAKHYYQPLWTLVAGGVANAEKSFKNMEDIMPAGVDWVQKSANTFDPKNNRVTMEDGSSIDYDFLVVAAGIQIDWDAIKGLREGLETENSGVGSVYDYNYAEKTWREYQRATTDNQKPCKMLFTMSPTPIKCAGAPQKIMWLIEDTLRGNGKRDQADISFCVPGSAMFGVKFYSDRLEEIRKERGVNGMFHHDLKEIDVKGKVAHFKNNKTGNDVAVPFDFLHVAPHMSAPNFIKSSPLASDNGGWMKVDKATLQSPDFPNVFGIGDCTDTPNSKTAAAVTSQAPVLVHNLTSAIEGKPLDGAYKGYASCPLVISKNKVILAEFGYGGKLMETFNWETGKLPLCLFGQDGELQHRFFYFLKDTFFPFAYWNMWVQGKWYGANGPIKPDVTK